MTQIRIESGGRFEGRAPVGVNGRVQRFPVGVSFEASADDLAALAAAGVPYSASVAAGGATGRITITAPGSRVPVAVNGQVGYLACGTPFTPTAAQLEALRNSSIPFEIETTTGGSTYGANVLVNGTFTGTVDPWSLFEGGYDIDNARVNWEVTTFPATLFQQVVTLEAGAIYAVFLRSSIAGNEVRVFFSATPTTYLTVPVGETDGLVGSFGPFLDGASVFRVRDAIGGASGWMDAIELRKVLS